MKTKFLILMLVPVFLLYLVQCGSEPKPTPPPEPVQPPAPLYNVGMWVPVGVQKDEPVWVDQDTGITEFNSQKYMWFKGEGDSVDRTVADRTARGDAQSRLAELLKLVVVSQYAQAWDALGIGEDESVEKVKQGIIATKTKVSVSGLHTLQVHKQQMAQLVKVPQGNITSGDLGNKTVWRYSVQMGIPYDEYVRQRKDLIDKVKTQVAANDRQKELINKADKALADIDKSPDDISVKVAEKNPA